MAEETISAATAQADDELLARVASTLMSGTETDVADLRDALAACIEQTLLDPLAGYERVSEWVAQNAAQGFATLCVQPAYLGRSAWELAQAQSPSPASTVLMYPCGQGSLVSVCFDTAFLIAAGACELDLAVNMGALIEGDFDCVAEAVANVLNTVHADECSDECGCGCDDDCEYGHDHDHGDECGCGHDHDDECGCDCDHGHDDDDDDEDDEDFDDESGASQVLVKAVIEAGVLSPSALCQAVDVISSFGVDFVQYGTLLGPCGATADDIRLVAATVEPGVEVKASADVQTLSGLLDLLEAGADRVGTTHGDAVLAEFDALVERLGLLDVEAE